jgi:hypothetical protein
VLSLILRHSAGIKISSSNATEIKRSTSSDRFIDDSRTICPRDEAVFPYGAGTGRDRRRDARARSDQGASNKSRIAQGKQIEKRAGLVVAALARLGHLASAMGGKTVSLRSAA